MGVIYEYIKYIQSYNGKIQAANEYAMAEGQDACLGNMRTDASLKNESNITTFI